MASAELITVPYSVEDAAIPGLGLTVSSQSNIDESDMGSHVTIIYGDQNADYINLMIGYSKHDPARDTEWPRLQKRDSSSLKSITDNLPAANVFQAAPVGDGHSYAFLYQPTSGEDAGAIIGERNYIFLDRGGVDIGATIYGYFKSGSPEQARTMMNKVEQKMNQLLSGEALPTPTKTPDSTLTVSVDHYHPFDLEKLKNNPDRRGGDVVITVRDAKGPVKDKTVYIFPEASTSIAFNALIDMPQGNSYMSAYDSIDPGVVWTSYDTVITDENGQAVWNYIHTNFIMEQITTYGVINYAEFETPLKNNGQVRGFLRFVAFDRDPLAAAKAGSRADVRGSESLPLEFNAVAMITSIEPGKDTKDPFVVVTQDFIKNERVDISRLPYPLIPGDHVLLYNYDSVDIVWLTGQHVTVTPKKGFIDSDHPYADLWIGSKDAGWCRWITLKSSSVKTHLMNLVTTGLSLKFSSPPITTLSVIKGAAVIVFSVVWNTGSYFFDPLTLEYHSKILISFTNSSAEIYTLEGKGTLHNLNDGSKVDINSGYKLEVSQSGVPSQPGKFNGTDLGTDLQFLLNAGGSTGTPTNLPVTATPKSPAPGLLAAVAGVLFVGYLLRWRNGR